MRRADLIPLLLATPAIVGLIVGGLIVRLYLAPAPTEPLENVSLRVISEKLDRIIQLLSPSFPFQLPEGSEQHKLVPDGHGGWKWVKP